MCVNGDKAERRPVTLGPVVDGLRVVRQGIKPDDQVVINGLMKIQPDAPGESRGPWANSPPTWSISPFASNQLEMKTSMIPGKCL